MAICTLSDLLAALDRNASDDLTGIAECEWLDFKSNPYQLDHDRGVRDLVADVAAFANHEGGAIVIGIATVKKKDKQEEVSTRARGVPVDLVDDEQVLALVRQHIQPLVHVEIRHDALASDSELVTLVVQRQPASERPCLVARVLGPDDKKVPHAIGWPTRHGSATHWEAVGRIQQLVASGLNAPGSQTRRDQAEPQSDVPASELGTPVAASRRDEAEAHIEVLGRHLELLDQLDNWEEWPRIIVQAFPEQSGRSIPDFLGQFAEDMRRRKNVRALGFGPRFDGQSLQPEGQDLIATDSRQFVAIHRSGVVTAAVNGTSEMLAWGGAYSATRGEHTGPIIANPYVVVEFASEVVRLVEEDVMPHTEDSEWIFRAIGKRLRGDGTAPLHLRPEPRPSWFPDRHLPPITDEFTEEIEVTGDTWLDAFAVVSEIYASGFGCANAEMSWLGDGRVDLEQLNKHIS